MKVHTPSFRIAGTKSPAGLNGKVSSPKSISRHISGSPTPISIPQKSIVRHVALYSRFLLSLSQERRPARFEEVATEHVEMKAGEARGERKRETDSLAPFAPFCATHPSRGGTRSRVLGFLAAGNHRRFVRARFLSATCFSLRREGRQARVRPSTTFDRKSYGGKINFRQRRPPS